MKCFEIEKYKVMVLITESDLLDSGIGIDDILDRNPKGFEYIKKIRDYAIRTTDYEWPGCAYSMEMKPLENNCLGLIFSETVSDFVEGLRNSQKIADHGSILLRELIKRIEESDEDKAREIIREFEKNVREVKG